MEYFEIDGNIAIRTREELKRLHKYYLVDGFILIEEDGVFDNNKVNEGDVIMLLFDTDERGKRKYQILDSNNHFAKRINQLKDETI